MVQRYIYIYHVYMYATYATRLASTMRAFETREATRNRFNTKCASDRDIAATYKPHADA